MHVCHNPIPFLRNHRATIQVLSLLSAYFRAGELDDFPHVRVLTVHTVHVEGGVSTLMRLFPNAEDVTIIEVQRDPSCRLARWEQRSYFTPDELEELRRLHRAHVSSAEQLVLQPRAWGRLRRVATHYVLGLYLLYSSRRAVECDSAKFSAIPIERHAGIYYNLGYENLTLCATTTGNENCRRILSDWAAVTPNGVLDPDILYGERSTYSTRMSRSDAADGLWRWLRGVQTVPRHAVP
ncbi:hypothetical protein OH76DRAFT_1004741 [Lentinus brumalis]|uniref:Uncharacterized protein n=1 Tax=Lentinus brumalis TaxID=2498619 RepID=A0A371CYK5_9APHY|nr:hypothetical protein OH76DRAFT_1004741 [Polyporus brumalis]